MNNYFHPSPRPSSLECLSNEQLLNIYDVALSANASDDFLEIIRDVLSKRRVYIECDHS